MLLTDQHLLRDSLWILILSTVSFTTNGILPTVLLLASVQIISRSHFTSFNLIQPLLYLLTSLTAGTTLSLFLTIDRTISTSSSSENLIAYLFISIFYRLTPVWGLLLSAWLRRLVRGTNVTSREAFSICGPALILSLTGIVAERSGAGRTFWWINDVGGRENLSLGWLGAYGGPVVLDFLWGAVAISLAEWRLSHTISEGKEMITNGDDAAERNLLDREETGEDVDDVVELDLEPHPPTSALSRPYIPLLLIASLILLNPLFTPASSSFHHSHPSPLSPSYRYPPLSVGCVSPPLYSERHRKQNDPDTPASGTNGRVGSIEDWIRETRVVASRGAKVISWSEGAVRLERGSGKKEDSEKKGWEGMGESERDLLRKVQGVADLYRVFIEATYMLPSTSSPHKVYNLATLIGPTSSSTPSIPNILYSQSKSHPVPFVESYSHVDRFDPELNSIEGNLPLVEIDLQHHLYTPSPKLTPLQSLSISSAICLDISFPSLLNSYHSNSNPKEKSIKSPSLLLNPSSTPLESLAQSQLAQLSSRAIEQNTFILRCDTSGGISTLVGPDGIARVTKPGSEGWSSWIGEIDTERAEATTLFNNVGNLVGGGGEFTTWFLLLLLVLVGMSLSRINFRVESSAAAKERVGEAWTAVRKGWNKVTERIGGSGLIGRRVESEEVGRLVDID